MGALQQKQEEEEKSTDHSMSYWISDVDVC